MKTSPDAPRIEPVNVPGCFIRIQGTYSSLRTAEQRVADFILKHAEELIYLTVTELAERTQTSESTVVRLCQKIGYKGYQEFKIMLARDLVGPTETVYEQIDSGDSLESLKTKVFQANAQALKDTIEVLSDEELGRAVEAIGRARRVEIYGIGGSAPLALDAYHKFMKLGVSAVWLNDSDLHGDVVVVAYCLRRSTWDLAYRRLARRVRCDGERAERRRHDDLHHAPRDVADHEGLER